jgi:hypothetical protein
MLVDLRKKLVIPPEITETILRTDIVIMSRKTKDIVLLELTIPWEESAESAHEHKRAKYQELFDDFACHFHIVHEPSNRGHFDACVCSGSFTSPF